MQCKLIFSDRAKTQLADLKATNESKFAKINRTLGLMETNLRHQSLHTHEYESILGENGEKVWEAYVENNTPGAYRVFWHYGPDKGVITVIAVTPHP